MGYHYGKTIREHRLLSGLTLSQLASQWPSKELGVTARYVSDIERGVKNIGDTQVLRELARILDIPLWRLGLSEYNPFQETGGTSMFFDRDSLEELIQDTWYIRLSMPVNVTEEKVKKLSDIFTKLVEINPLLKQNKDFLRLYAQIIRLQAIMCVEKKQYDKALQLYHKMLGIANEIQDSVTLALAYSRIGVELLRQDELKNALIYLEKATDVSFLTGKELAGLCFAMLARGYAQVGDEKQFERAINTAINFAYSMQEKPLVTQEFVFHSYSGILEEKSNGLILLQQGKKAIDMLPDIEKHIGLENHAYLNMWIPLDYAQAHMLQGEIEESIKQLRQFYENIKGHKSMHVMRKVYEHLSQMETRGYVGLQVVRSFIEEIHVSPT
jgi:transcriptional regulator with XRE-family HTH domain